MTDRLQWNTHHLKPLWNATRTAALDTPAFTPTEHAILRSLSRGLTRSHHPLTIRVTAQATSAHAIGPNVVTINPSDLRIFGDLVKLDRFDLSVVGARPGDVFKLVLHEGYHQWSDTAHSIGSPAHQRVMSAGLSKRAATLLDERAANTVAFREHAQLATLRAYKKTVDEVHGMVPQTKNLTSNQFFRFLVAAFDTIDPVQGETPEDVQHAMRQARTVSLTELRTTVVDDTVNFAEGTRVPLKARVLNKVVTIGKATLRTLGWAAAAYEVYVGVRDAVTANTWTESAGHATVSTAWITLGILAPYWALGLAVGDLTTSFVVDHHIAQLEQAFLDRNDIDALSLRGGRRASVLRDWREGRLSPREILEIVERGDLLAELELEDDAFGWRSGVEVNAFSWGKQLQDLGGLVEFFQEQGPEFLDAYDTVRDVMSGGDIDLVQTYVDMLNKPWTRGADPTVTPELWFSYHISVPQLIALKEAADQMRPLIPTLQPLIDLQFVDYAFSDVAEMAKGIVELPEKIRQSSLDVTITDVDWSLADQYKFVELFLDSNPGMENPWNPMVERGDIDIVQAAVFQTIVEVLEGAESIETAANFSFNGLPIEVSGYSPGLRVTVDDVLNGLRSPFDLTLNTDDLVNLSGGFGVQSATILVDDRFGFDHLFVNPLPEDVAANVFTDSSSIFSFDQTDLAIAQIDSGLFVPGVFDFGFNSLTAFEPAPGILDSGFEFTNSAINISPFVGLGGFDGLGLHLSNDFGAEFSGLDLFSPGLSFDGFDIGSVLDLGGASGFDGFGGLGSGFP